MNNQPARMGVGVISAGRVGTVLASALRSVGHHIIGVHAVSEASKERADSMLPGVPILEPQEIIRRSELVILAIPDDQLPSLMSGLEQVGAWQMGQVVLHTSGRYGLDVLAPAARAGAITLALHPAMTFSGTSMDIPRLVGCPMAVAGQGPMLPIAQALAVELGGEPYVIDDDKRPLYHAALSHGANHMVTLVSGAMKALALAGVDEPGTMLAPLLHAALDRALHEGQAALTGPISRGDVGTVRAHCQALAAETTDDASLDDVLRAYRAMGLLTAQQCVERGAISAQTYEQILHELQTNHHLEVDNPPEPE
ncbi:Rossmann-like and DUF2520 domain-containing protein [Actinomyces vulturis]|uniref:Rossmann-like and DUF2520 domain-containing protein n=1 Tax=Actinomyces vulturis TaxID=1857645 RepID=UPI0008319BC8|nr:DUF2520 domain-containing protein [Actinomyces vulturis]